MITIYDRKATNFNNNGLAVLSDCKSCFITEKLNNEFELTLEYPKDQLGKSDNLKKWNIIKADGQLFRIYRVERTLSDVKVTARHIFYDLLYNFNEDVRATNVNCASALTMLLTCNSAYSVESDITTLETAYFIRENPVKSLFDKVIPRWNGELVRDNFIVKVLQSRGQDKGVLISYGKNITGIKEEINTDIVITRIFPIGNDGLTLTEKYIDSPLIENEEYPPFPIIKDVSFSVSTEAELRQVATDYLSIVDKPIVNYAIDFIELSKTEEYKNYASLESIELGDIVIVKHSKLGINLKLKVISLTKDVLKNRITKVELGNYKPTIVNKINDLEKSSIKIENVTDSNGDILAKQVTDKITADLIAALNLEVGNQILMGENAEISWAKVTGDKPTQYTNAQALAAWIASGYATHITSSGIYTGTLTAQQIIALGTIQGLTLQTAASGRRVGIEAQNIVLYNDSAVHLQIGFSSAENTNPFILFGNGNMTYWAMIGFNETTGALDISTYGSGICRLNGSQIATQDWATANFEPKV